MRVVEQLQEAGYEAYIVGGGIRDLLLNALPKDFDVATSAKPEEVKRLFRRCFLIGRRFRLAHVHLKGEMVEVATFRAEHHKGSKHGHKRGGLIIRDNIYGTLEEDAVRRDFTLNALYYDPVQNTILDHMHALQDIQTKTLRMIGDPKKRYQEDPVRMLRAIRLACKLNLLIETKTLAPLAELALLLQSVSPARLVEEVSKLFLSEYGVLCFEKLRELGLFSPLFPQTEAILKEDLLFKNFIVLTLEDTAFRLKQGEKASFNFILAALLWQPFKIKFESASEKRFSSVVFDYVCQDFFKEQSSLVLITRKNSEMIQAIWKLQWLLEARRPRSIRTVLRSAYFSAADDFLKLRHAAGEPLAKVIAWWDKAAQKPPEAEEEA